MIIPIFRMSKKQISAEDTSSLHSGLHLTIFDPSFSDLLLLFDRLYSKDKIIVFKQNYQGYGNPCINHIDPPKSDQQHNRCHRQDLDFGLQGHGSAFFKISQMFFVHGSRPEPCVKPVGTFCKTNRSQNQKRRGGQYRNHNSRHSDRKEEKPRNYIKCFHKLSIGGSLYRQYKLPSSLIYNRQIDGVQLRDKF